MPTATEVQVATTSEQRSEQKKHVRVGFATIIVVAMLAAECIWVLHLPVFPAQDGPVHVYYARVTRDLLDGGHAYGQQFRVARPFPPYSIHAYLLMGLLSFVTGAMAEKIVVCLAMMTCALGLAFLARTLGRVTMFLAIAMPFLLNRYLFLGFYGYTISIGVALVAMAFWLRSDRRLGARIVFLLLAVLTLFSHPVPYLLLIAFCWLAVGAGWWNARQTSAAAAAEIERPTRGDVITLLLASSLFAYVKHYSHSGLLWNYEWLADWHDKLFRVIDVLRTRELLPLLAPVYNDVLAVGLAAAAVAALWQARRESMSGGITRVQLVAGFALLILIGLPLMPRTMNGSGFFAERFTIWPPLLLVTVACAFPLKIRWERAVAMLALVMVGTTLFVLNSNILPVARETDASAFPKDSLTGMRLLVRNESWAPIEFNYDPYLMSPVRIVDRTGGLLVDAPWLNLQIMMLEEIGPKTKLTRVGPQTLTPPATRLGLVDAHCGAGDGNTMAARIAARDPGQWRLLRRGCFDVLTPVP